MKNVKMRGVQQDQGLVNSRIQTTLNYPPRKTMSLCEEPSIELENGSQEDVFVQRKRAKTTKFVQERKLGKRSHLKKLIEELDKWPDLKGLSDEESAIVRADLADYIKEWKTAPSYNGGNLP